LFEHPGRSYAIEDGLELGHKRRLSDLATTLSRGRETALAGSSAMPVLTAECASPRQRSARRIAQNPAGVAI
jgi:hypothetical protein